MAVKIVSLIQINPGRYQLTLAQVNAKGDTIGGRVVELVAEPIAQDKGGGFAALPQATITAAVDKFSAEVDVAPAIQPTLDALVVSVNTAKGFPVVVADAGAAAKG